VVLVVLLEIVSDDERRRHVDEARSEAVHEAVREEQPLGGLNERRSDETDGQDAGTEQTTDAETPVTEHPDESDRQRSARQRYAERQSPDPVCMKRTSQISQTLYILYSGWVRAIYIVGWGGYVAQYAVRRVSLQTNF